MAVSFTTFFQRLDAHTDIHSQMDLARALGIHRSAITQAKLRDSIPSKWILALARHCSISADWLEFGTGKPHPSSKTTEEYLHTSQVHSTPLAGETIYIPKMRAKICAGGGSYEVEAIPVSEHPFPYKWLARMGNPREMIFMDVIGDSMEPSILDGDMVLIDQSGKAISPHNVYAVAFEDAIYLKRVEQRKNSIILHSDNPAYSDMEIYGDELAIFRIIGKTVWLCRDVYNR